MDADACYAALLARDRRFDGVFFVAVSTTGIYCRPICPARTPARVRCTFYARAAEAERDGFRACLRCRPERAPGDGAPVDARSSLVRRAVALIDAGALSERSLAELAVELGVTDRHLRRAMEAELGVSPIAWAETRRLALAKQLLQDTRVPITDVALASGYRSVRRFNAAFAARFGRSPSELRRGSEGAEGAEGTATAAPTAPRGSARSRAPRAAAPLAPAPAPDFTCGPDAIALRLEYRPPLDWSALLAFLAPRALAGVEVIDGESYARRVTLGDHAGVVRVSRPAVDAPLRAEVSAALAPVLMAVVSRLRALFDLDAHPARIAAHLAAADARLAACVARRPGLRVPGAFDAFEVAVRALLGQQVSVKAACTLAGRLVARLDGEVRADVLARTPVDEVAAIGLPRARAAALVTMARAVSRGELVLAPGVDPQATIAALEALPGIGPWTSNYLALRALSWPDALPAGDLVLRQRLGLASSRAVVAHAEAWRPWRAYAVMHLWTAGPEDER